MPFRRPVLAFFALLITFPVFAQRNTLSPYTFSGIGQLAPRIFAEQSFMGGISGVTGDVSGFSILNPASMAHLQHTTFVLGVNYEWIKQQTATESQRLDNGKMNYFALGVPLKEYGGFAFNIGLTPYSEVGYLLQKQQVEDSVEVLNTFEGKGGLNTFNAGLGRTILPGLSLGVNADFIFGNIVNIRDKQFVDNTDLFNYSDRIDAAYTGFKWNFGVQYISQNKGDISHRLAGTVSPGSNLRASSSRLVTSYNSKDGSAYLIDSILHEPNQKKEIGLPLYYSISYGLSNTEKWLFAAEYRLQAYHNFTDIRNEKNYSDQRTLMAGGYFQPGSIDEITRIRNLSDFLQVLRWYGGVSHTLLYTRQFVLPVEELGIGFGLGIPMIQKYRTPDGQSLKIVSRVFLGMEYLDRGTTDSGMLREQFTRIRIGVSLSDKWFIKRKYQ